MQLYLIKGSKRKRFAGSQAEMRKIRQEMIDQTGDKKKDIDVSQIDVPTSKTALLPFLNELCTEADDAPVS